MTKQLTFDELAAPSPEPSPALDADPDDDARRFRMARADAHYRRQHEEAMRSPKPGFEHAIVMMYRAMAEYADAHAVTYDCPISEDGVIGDAWADLGKALIYLLDGQTGRLDCGTLCSAIHRLVEAGGTRESIAEVREATKPIVPERTVPAKASRSSSPTVISTGMSALSERQRELLACIRVEDNFAVYARDEFIPDWPELKAIMLALGGTWSRKTKKRSGGFAFPDDADAAELVRLALETGEVMDPKAAEFFATPTVLADDLAAFIRPEPGWMVLEPSAGQGALVKALWRAGWTGNVTCVESFPPNVAALRALGLDPIERDFMRWHPERPVDAVVANPPFSRRQDVRHILHALDCLRVGGRFAAIASAGVKYRDDRLGREFRAVLDRHGAEIRENPEGSFAQAGTMVRTVSIFLEKRA